jgi:aminopeptidase N
MPFSVGLLDAQGQELPLQLDGESAPQGTHRVLSLRQETEVFRFVGISGPPVPSLGRNFSAPVIIQYDYSDEALALLFIFESDAFNRWEAGQRLVMKFILLAIADYQNGRRVQFPDAFTRGFGRALEDGAKNDAAFAAEVLALPLEVYIGEQLPVVDPDAIHQVRKSLRRQLAESLQSILRTTYDACKVVGPYSPDAESVGRRSLRNLSLAYLMELNDPGIRRLCDEQLRTADNMTDALSALTSLANCDCPERLPALAAFYDKWKDEPLAVDKWLGVQAASSLPGTVEVVRKLTTHPAFDMKNPNKVYALLGSFGGNQFNFHAADGSGYAFYAEQIAALDAINPQVAARLTRNLERWKRFDASRQKLMTDALKKLASLPGLSKETSEVVTKSLS